MLSTKNCIYLGLIVAALVIFIPRSAAQTISCSSDDGKRHYCSTNGPGGYGWFNNAANLPAVKATVGARMTVASGSIMAAGLISQSTKGMTMTDIAEIHGYQAILRKWTGNFMFVR